MTTEKQQVSPEHEEDAVGHEDQQVVTSESVSCDHVDDQEKEEEEETVLEMIVKHKCKVKEQLDSPVEEQQQHVVKKDSVEKEAELRATSASSVTATTLSTQQQQEEPRLNATQVGAVAVSSSRAMDPTADGLDSSQEDDGEEDNHTTDDLEANLVEAELVESRDVVVAVAAPPPEKKKWIYLATGLLVVIVIVLVIIMATTLSRGDENTVPPPTQPQEQDQLSVDSTPSDDDTTTQDSSTTGIVQWGNTIIGSAAYDRFGEAIGLSGSGSIVAVAARNNGNVGFESGLVRVFQSARSSNNNNTVWAQLGNAIGGENPGDRFGFSGLSLSKDGLRVAVGAPFQNVTTTTHTGSTTITSILPHVGNVRVFDYVSSTPNSQWKQVGPSMEGIHADEWFGRSVVMSDDGQFVAACAYQGSNENGDENAGNVRIFRHVANDSNATTTSSSWEQVGQTLHGLGTLDRLGRSLAISANGYRVAAGANQFKKEPNGTGYVQVFDLIEHEDDDDEHWMQVGQTIFGDHDQDVMGREIALSSDGSILACSASLNSDNGEDAGMVRVYRHQLGSDSDAWQQLGQTILGNQAGERFGESLYLSGDGTRIAIGGTEKQTGEGVTRLFDYDRETDSWVQVGPDLNGVAVGDRFGADIQMSTDGSFLAVSSPSSDANGEDSGITQVFDLTAL
ncbi:expressed unknown protein [Seminavis robusta]|uniref:Uncharacterized protein n=1 Tax=Seminavis robusta TaxID=568900 RepID=A0A9N8F220_9STRA|nr:expressed unknown protein [Seminavis robusta]|eukprot:Sro2905_g339940.1 n/a (678) ;mRNA; r:3223-5256